LPFLGNGVTRDGILEIVQILAQGMSPCAVPLTV